MALQRGLTMALYKSAQDMMEINDLKDLGKDDEVILYEEKPDMEDVVELHQEPKETEVVFKLAPLPGSDAEIPLEVSTDSDIEVEEKTTKKDKNDVSTLEVADPWDTKSVKPDGAIEWAKARLQEIPRHDGKQILGIERVLSYLKRVDNEMSKMISGDYLGKIDIAAFEALRREIYDALPRLEKAKENLMKQYRHSADEKAGIVKEAKQTHVGSIIVTVPLLISTIARTMINGMVSGGHDIENMYAHQVKEYDLSKREQIELTQLLSDMGYFVRRDRLFPPESKEKWDVSDGKGDYASQYYS